MAVRRSATVVLAAGVLALGGVGTASASAPTAGTCSGGDVASGTYSSLTITGACTVPSGATVTVLHNLTVAPGASFDAQTTSTVTVDGNVLAGAGSQVGLGCTMAHPCSDGSAGPSNDTVWGNVVLNHVYNAAFNGDHIGGNLVVAGGGPGASAPGFIPFSVKDDVIGHNVIVSGLDTVWFGIIRSHIGGNVVLSNIHAIDPDANEVTTDTIAGNLICHGLSPAPQLGDALGDPINGVDTVGGQLVGQCANAGLTG